MTQLTVTQEPAIGFPGLIYDSSAPKDIISLIAQEDIPFGCFVRISGHYCELPDNSGEVTGHGGVALHDPSKATGVGYKAGDTISVMIMGRVWIRTEQAIAAQAQPFARFGAGAGGTQLGAWRADADTATAVAVPNARIYRGSTGANGLAVVELGKTGNL